MVGFSCAGYYDLLLSSSDALAAGFWPGGTELSSTVTNCCTLHVSTLLSRFLISTQLQLAGNLGSRA